MGKDVASDSKPRDPTLDDLFRIAHAETRQLLETGNLLAEKREEILADLTAEWRAKQKPINQLPERDPPKPDDPNANEPALITQFGNTTDEFLPEKGLSGQEQALQLPKEAESSAPVRESLAPAIEHHTPRSTSWAVLGLVR